MNPPTKRQKKDSDDFHSEQLTNNGQQLSNTMVHRPIPIYPFVFNTSHISLLHSNMINPIPHTLIPCNSNSPTQTTISPHGFTPFPLTLTNTNPPLPTHPLLFSNGQQINALINNWNSQQVVVQTQLPVQLSAFVNQQEPILISNRVQRDYTLLLSDELIVKIFDSFGCDERENYHILVNLFYVNFRWRKIITEPKNYRLMKTLRIGVSGIVFAQTGADYIFKVVEYEYEELMHIWSNEKDWITENAEDHWKELKKKRPVCNAPLPPRLEEDLSLKLSRFKPKIISFENIIIGKPLLRLLSKILSKYARHDEICFAKYDDEDCGLSDVMFDDNVDSDDITALFPHFFCIRSVPPRYWDEHAFNEWVLAEKRSDYLFEEDYSSEDGFENRNGKIKNYPISLENFSRVHIFTSDFAETSINEIMEAAKARMMDDQEGEQGINWHMAIAEMNVNGVGILMQEAGERHNIQMSTPLIAESSNGHGTVVATFKINEREAFVEYFNYSFEPPFVEIKSVGRYGPDLGVEDSTDSEDSSNSSDSEDGNN